MSLAKDIIETRRKDRMKEEIKEEMAREPFQKIIDLEGMVNDSLNNIERDLEAIPFGDMLTTLEAIKGEFKELLLEHLEELEDEAYESFLSNEKQPELESFFKRIDTLIKGIKELQDIDKDLNIDLTQDYLKDEQ